MHRAKLRVELVPNTAWSTNLRQILTQREWDILKQHVYQLYENQCGICGGVGNKHPVEAHEVWKFDESTGIQKLVRIEAICPMCHKVKHIGFTQTLGHHVYEAAVNHLCRVNEWTREKAFLYIQKKHERWQRQNDLNWTLDLTNLKHYTDDPNVLSKGLVRTKIKKLRAQKIPMNIDADVLVRKRREGKVTSELKLGKSTKKKIAKKVKAEMKAQSKKTKKKR